MKNTIAQDLLNKTIIKIDGAYAPSTIRAYKANFERFIHFCENHQALALPASSEITSIYIRKIADGRLRSASIRIAVASISAIHRLNQFNDPTMHPDVKIEMRRMHRKLGRESKQAQGINITTLRNMLAHNDNSLISLRDRALVLTAYDGMCRRSELVSLNIEDISLRADNSMKIKLRRSKTDQDGLMQHKLAQGRYLEELIKSEKSQKSLDLHKLIESSRRLLENLS
jgi:site-specific recombinase XerD